MGYEKSEPKSPPIINLTSVGEVKEGWFLGCRKGQFGMLYDFITRKGEMFTLKHNSDLVLKMSCVPEKVYCRITLTGHQKSSKGNDMKVFTVEFDRENIFQAEYQAKDSKNEKVPF